MKYLQSVERFTEAQITGYRAVYSNGLDFKTVNYPIRDGATIINIPSIIDD